MRFFFWVSVDGGPLEPAEVFLVGTMRTVRLIGCENTITLGEKDTGVVVYGEIGVPECPTPGRPAAS